MKIFGRNHVKAWEYIDPYRYDNKFWVNHHSKAELGRQLGTYMRRIDDLKAELKEAKADARVAKMLLLTRGGSAIKSPSGDPAQPSGPRNP